MGAPIGGVVVVLAFHAHRPDGQLRTVVLNEAEGVSKPAHDPRGGHGVHVDRGVAVRGVRAEGRRPAIIRHARSPGIWPG
ncbi:hypothetical protein QFZ64_007006 [Streptomyces sp. B3I8]|nr:hypothetical protein [Streptomyces sp. B3I8]MDQ0791509.1 hypothetical protein [Streptomyces sp. B3I8]